MRLVESFPAVYYTPQVLFIRQLPTNFSAITVRACNRPQPLLACDADLGVNFLPADPPICGRVGAQGLPFSSSVRCSAAARRHTHTPACHPGLPLGAGIVSPPLANAPRSARFTTTLVSHVSLRAAGGGTRRARPCMIPTNRTIRTHTTIRVWDLGPDFHTGYRFV